MIGFIIGACVGLVVGWVVLPAPKFVMDLWVKYGWAKPAPPATP